MIIKEESALTGNQYRHGRYIIRTERRGPALLYDVTQGGLVVSSGFDMTSFDERATVQAIKDRLGKFKSED
jgi:hypothetical protein